MSKYDVNIKNLALSLVPMPLRKIKLVSLVYCLTAQISSLTVTFRGFREDAYYRLVHNGQVCHLAALLNDEFDQLSRRITISDAEEGEQMLAYARKESHWLMLTAREQDSQILNGRSYSGSNTIDFVVNVPEDLTSQIDRIKALVDKYRLASKRFTIQISL